MAVRGIADNPFSARASAIAAHHVGGRTGLVDEDEAMPGKALLPFSPFLPSQGDVSSELFGGVNGFF